MATEPLDQRLQRLASLPQPTPWQRRRNFLIAHHHPILGAIGLLVLLLQWRAGIPPRDVSHLLDPLVAAGLLLIAAGLGLRSWGAGVLFKSKTLATTGPYRLCRHPLYLGSLLLMAGFSLLVTPPQLAWLFLVPYLVIHLFRLQREEEVMAAKFGVAWARYAAEVPRLVPFRLPSGLGSHWSFAQWRRNHEYRAVAGAVLVLALLLLWREWL